MGIQIIHASKDENNRYTNGVSGDQTGQEVCIRSWYNRPWNVILRAKDAVIAEKIAEAMESAAANNNIGYDQNNRNSLLNCARPYGYNPAKVTTKCETDCSALVALACMYAGIPESALVEGGNSAYTGNLKSKLLATGKFEEFTTDKYTKSDKYLKRGDILLYEGHHVAVAKDDGEEVKSIVNESTTTNEVDVDMDNLVKGSTGSQVKTLQRLLKSLGYYRGNIDGDFGTQTETAVKKFQTDKNIKVAYPGTVGPKTWTVLLKKC